MKPLAATLLAAVLLLCGACADSGDRAGPSHSTTGSERSAPSPTGQETTGAAAPEATLGTGPEPPAAVLRLEGDPKTTFSGICSAGGQESVLSGRVPKRFTFDLDGQKLSCRIQKQDSARGKLKVTLIADGKTHSVQQTNSRGGVITTSYEGG